jgi:hypothetical protein
MIELAEVIGELRRELQQDLLDGGGPAGFIVLRTGRPLAGAANIP